MTISAWATLASEPTPDQAWTDTVALLVLDATTGTTSAKELGLLRNQIADKALTEHDSTAAIGAQLRLLVVQLDAAIWRRQTTEDLVAKLTGRRARVIQALRDMGGTAFTDDLCAATELKPPHISKVCGDLLDAGLLIRQSFGKRAEWTLVPQATPALKDPETDKTTEHDEGAGKTTEDPQIIASRDADAVRELVTKIIATTHVQAIHEYDYVKPLADKVSAFGADDTPLEFEVGGRPITRSAAFQKRSPSRLPKS
ncbi:MAG: MarR family transcriptional regulator [Actinobacteria bacterium]|nr:MarR family transcriptional regulator [Actinomycetota bacterium]